jgi:hypothetical protein
MPLEIPHLQTVTTLFNRLRWVVTLLIFGIALGLGWYGWQNGSGQVLVFFGILMLLALVLLIWGGHWTVRLAQHFAGKMIHQESRVVKGWVGSGLKKGEQLAQAGSKELGKTFNSAVQELDHSLDRLSHEIQPNPGSVTRVSAPTPILPTLYRVCPVCGKEQRSSAKFCDHCGTLLERLCRYCGQALRPQAHFCDHCGKAQE